MAPLIVLVVSAVAFWLAGRAGMLIFQDVGFVLRSALAVMFFLTASAHFGKRRPDLIRMVPPGLPRPDLLVTLTGVLEILGALGENCSRLKQPFSRWVCKVRSLDIPHGGLE